jgi:dienelactone hydrolase
VIRKAGSVTAFVIMLALAACTNASTSSLGETGSSLLANARSTTRPNLNVPIVVTHISVSLPAGSAQSSMNVLVLYPRAKRPLPLVIFSHGYGSDAEIYKPFLEEVARGGYVVAGPDYPEAQYTVHPGQISAVIDTLTTEWNGLPHGLVDGRHIAAMGHSLGGTDVYGVTYNLCCRDKRISAAVTLEGALLPFPGGSYAWQGTPLLMVLDTNDPVIPYATGTDILSSFRRNAYLLTIDGGMHDGGMDVGAPGHRAMLSTLYEFLAAYLGGDERELRTLRTSQHQGTHLSIASK